LIPAAHPLERRVYAKRSIMRDSARELFAGAGTSVVRRQLSPVLSIPRSLDAQGNVSAELIDNRLLPRCVVYDLLGRVVHTNDSDDHQSWSLPFGGTYFVLEPKAARLTTRQF